MKIFKVVVFLIVLSISCKAQDIAFLMNKLDTVQSDKLYNIRLKKFSGKTKDSTYYLTFKFLKDVTQPLRVKLVDNDKGSGNIGKDYEYEKALPIVFHILPSSSKLFTIGFRVLSNSENKYAELHIYLEDGNLIEPYLIRINFNPGTTGSKPKATIPDTSKWSLKFITGSNFDFFDAPKFKNFAGELKLFAPNIWRISKKDDGGSFQYLGLQFGFFNYRYFDSDSSMSNIRTEKYLLHPTEKIRPDTSKLVRSTYSTNTKTDYNLWGIYINPLFNLTNIEKDAIAQVYFAPHFEAIIRTQITTGRKIPLRKDTLTITGSQLSDQSFVVQSYPAINPAYQRRTFYDYYFGIGIPMRINFKKAFIFDFQPVVGYALYQIPGNVTSSQINSNYIPYPRDKRAFLLGKIQLITTLAPVDIALGGEFRSIVNDEHYFALYLGAAITLDKLKK